MNILVVPDKFKGSLTAKEASEAIKEGILKFDKLANVEILPLADGGEGSLEVIEDKLNFKRVYVDVCNPTFERINTWYGLLNETAYIEMAKASGLLLLADGKRSATSTTTLGTGKLIADALTKGARKIYLFAGGSATNDAGIGMAHALGYRFLDVKKEILLPIGGNLNKIVFIKGNPNSKIRNTEFILVTDVENPLFGDNGAAKVFAKQKGANDSDVSALDIGLQNFNDIIKTKFEQNVSRIPGAGAAGGLGAGALIFLNAKIERGINTIMKILNVESVIKNIDLIISGEGKLDKQTFEGKVIKGVSDKCVEFKKSLGIVCGISELTNEELNKLPIKALVTIKNEETSLDESIYNAYYHLVNRSEALMKQLH